MKSRLTEAQKDLIFQLVEDGLHSTAIAARISARPSTVCWFMYVNGLVKRRSPRVAASYTRADGTRITRFQPDEDAMMVALRLEGLSPRQIAARLAAAFQREVKPHSVKVRLVVLASHRARAEAA